MRWADEFKKIHPEVKIDISAGGAGKEITGVLSGMIDLGMVSRGIKDAETAKGALPIAYQEKKGVNKNDHPFLFYIWVAARALLKFIN